jgi:flagellar biosynthesis/type III secretory pathway protein FliH
MTDICTPHEIVGSLRDSGIIDTGTPRRLEQRIIAWAESQKAEGRRDGIADALRRAQAVVARIRSAAQRAAAEKALRAIEKLLPQGQPAIKEAYTRGYSDGAAAVSGDMATS